jgi:hypothetical protein
MTGEIYSKATKVYAWLGETDRQIDCVFNVLQEFRDRKREAKFLAHFDAAEQLSFHRQLFAISIRIKPVLHINRAIWTITCYTKNSTGFVPCICGLTSAVSTYWRRVWIVQELVMAKVVVTCCRDKFIDFDIYGLSLDWDSFEQGFDTGTYQMLKKPTRGWNTIQTIRGLRRRREVE